MYNNNFLYKLTNIKIFIIIFFIKLINTILIL